jgi:predicted nucleic acid-binding protein
MSAVLVDTSVWVAHFRHANAVLAQLLWQDAVLCHPWVLGEVACGTPPTREQTLNDLAALQMAQVASIQELLVFADRERLYGLGCGMVDLGLLASTRLTPGAQLWTLDRRLAGLAERFGVAFEIRET